MISQNVLRVTSARAPKNTTINKNSTVVKWLGSRVRP